MVVVGKPKGSFAAGKVRSRHRVGPSRRISATVLLVLIVAVALLYHYQTQPEQVCARARDYLTRLTGGDVIIGRATFSLFEGIRLSQVCVSFAPDSGFLPEQTRARDREVFRVDELHLHTSIPRALLGRPIIDQIIASNAVFTLVRRTHDGRYNWQELLTGRPAQTPARDMPLPELRLRDVRIRLCKLGEDGLTDLDNIALNVLACPVARATATYAVRWRQRGTEDKRGVAHVRLDRPGFDAGTGGLPTLKVESVLAAMPGNVAAFSRWLSLLNLRGRLGVDALTISDTEPDRAFVRLDGLSFSIPLDESEHDLPADERLVRLDNVNGGILWTEGQLKADIEGDLNGQLSRMAATLRVPPGGEITWDQVGFDVQLNVDRFEMPPLTDDPSDRASALIRRFAPLHALYRRFNPSGCVGVELSLRRESGAEAEVQLDRCTVTAKGANAMYAKFPVPVTDLHGRVIFTGDGITIDDLTGKYRSGTATLSGTAVSTLPTTGIDVLVQGRNVPLDETIRRSLAPKYQELWEQFAPDGNVDVNVRLFRDHSYTEPSALFQNEVDIEFLGVNGRFARLPYPLENVRGRVLVSSGRTQIEELTSQRGPTRMRADGTVTPGDDGRAVLDLKLDVEGLPVDETLIQSLPPDAQESLRRLELTGRLNFDGPIGTDPVTGRIRFDMKGDLVDGTARPSYIPLLLKDVEGGFRVLPDRVDLVRWAGHYGPTEVEADGTFWLGGAPGKDGRPWRVRCDAVQLDDELRDVLPEDFLRVWDEVGATGRIDVEFVYDKGRPDPGQAYRAVITAHQIGLCLKRFPWTLEDVTGQVIVTPSLVELLDVRAHHEDAEIWIRGLYDRPTGAAQGSLRAENVLLNEQLRQAVPWRVRRSWNVMEPSGRIGLQLDRLLRRVDAEGHVAWSCEGGIDLTGVSLESAITVKDAFGHLEGGGRFGPEADWSLDGELSITHAAVKDHRLSDLRCKVIKSKDPATLDFVDVTATLHHGRAMGEVHVDLEPGGGYDFSLVAQDMSLQPFLAALAGADQVPKAMHGLVRGKLFYTAWFDEPDRGRGGGELSVSGGNVFSTPLMLSVLGALNPVPPVGDYQDAALRFYLSRRQLDLHSIEIRDRSLVMTGSGVMNLPANSLNVVLLVGEPTEEDSPFTALPEFIQGALRELVEIRIVGEPAQPDIQARPLRGLDEAVRILTESRKGFQR
ncbi:MAG: hypothetical protein JSU68_12720 [Phycisphaerales bacterium]|nr:MAG: hypothetical protein JSU68_12720 [Phycisphaerales bacterium]